MADRQARPGHRRTWATSWRWSTSTSRFPTSSSPPCFYVVGLGLTRDPVPDGRPHEHVGQHRPAAVPPADRAGPGRCGATWDSSSRTSTSCRAAWPWSGWPARGDAVRLLGRGQAHPRGLAWGNVIRCHPPGPAFADMTLGMPYVEFAVEQGTADGIARFYREALGAPASVSRNGGGDDGAGHGRASAGAGLPRDCRPHSALRRAPRADLHHELLGTAPLARRAGARHRGEQLVPVPLREHRGPDSGRVLFTIEHEVQSLRSPPLPPSCWSTATRAQRQPTYQRGRDAFVPGMSWLPTATARRRGPRLRRGRTRAVTRHDLRFQVLILPARPGPRSEPVHVTSRTSASTWPPPPTTSSTGTTPRCPGSEAWTVTRRGGARDDADPARDLRQPDPAPAPRDAGAAGAHGGPRLRRTAGGRALGDRPARSTRPTA